MKNLKTFKIASFTAMVAFAISGVCAMNANTASAATEGGFQELGASIRVAEDKGIRFAFGLPENVTGEGYEIGTLVVPKALLGSAELNHNSDTADTVEVDYQAIPCTKNWVPHDLIEGATEGYNYYNAALTNIPTVDYNTVLVARSYYVKDGVYTYSEPVERSIGYVASAALNDGFEDTNDILTGIVTTGFGETAFTAESTGEVVKAKEVMAVTANNELNYLPVWSTSDETIATVDKTGKVTGVKSGEVTVTATIGETKAEKKLYVAGEGLVVDQIGGLINGYNFGADTNYFNKAAGENGDFTVNAKLLSNPSYHSALILRQMYSKEYYEKLAANGYKMTFTLGVSEATTTNFSDLYVFGKKLTNFPKNADGEFAVVVDTKYIAENYDAISTITNAQAGASKRDKMFIAWAGINADYSTKRNYVFTFSNVQFVSSVLYADDFGFRNGGVNKTYSDMKLEVGENGEIIIDATFNATADYGSFLMFNNMNTITYLGGLSGKYASFTFELTVGGADYDKVSDLHVFGTAKALSTCNKVEGKENTYVVEIRLDKGYFTDSNWKTNINTLATSTSTVGSWNARSQMLLAWRYNGSNGFKNPNNQSRSYTFTISNFELRNSLLYTY